MSFYLVDDIEQALERERGRVGGLLGVEGVGVELDIVDTGAAIIGSVAEKLDCQSMVART